MSRRICDPKIYPECCWTHKRESLLGITGMKYYCKKCRKYHKSKNDISKYIVSPSSNSSDEQTISTSIHIISNNVPIISSNDSNKTNNCESNDSETMHMNNISASYSGSIEDDKDNGQGSSETIAIDPIELKYDTKKIITESIKKIQKGRLKEKRKLNRRFRRVNNKNKTENKIIIDKTKNTTRVDRPENKTEDKTNVLDKTDNNILKKKYEITDYKQIKPLGKGGFATVYLCQSPDKKLYAMKKIINKPNRGVPCLMEASIMATYKHNHLSNIVCAGAKSDGLYMVLKLAHSDLSKWRSKNDPTNDLIRKIFYQISQAILFLHRENIIHGDVKCSNILVYDTDDFHVKLSDFNLSSVNTWESNLKVCTATHRPIEVWRGDKWDEKIDIWSLGCAMFELKYGYGLIPYQGPNSGKEQYMNALFDWATGGLGGRLNRNKHKLRGTRLTPRYYNVSYKNARIPKSIHKIKTPFTELLSEMLKSEPKGRPTIEQLVCNPYFDGLKEIRGKRSKRINTVEDNNIFDPENIEKLKNDLSHYTNESAILDLAVRIYSRYCLITNNNNNWTKLTCVWIARKLIRKKHYDIRIPIENKNSNLRKKIYQLEQDICSTLGYRLHLH